MQDVSILAFNFTVADPSLRFVQIELVFASDEFPESSSSPFVDIAAVFVNGVNYALFDGQANQPLSVIDRIVDTGALQNNGDGHIAIEYDGVSRKLVVTAPVHAGVNTLKLAVGDTGDGVGDSAIFVANLRAVAYGGAGMAQRQTAPPATTAWWVARPATTCCWATAMTLATAVQATTCWTVARAMTPCAAVPATTP